MFQQLSKQLAWTFRRFPPEAFRFEFGVFRFLCELALLLMGNEQSDIGELIVSIVATELSSDDCFFFDGVVVHISVDWSLLFDFFPPPFFLLVTITPKYLYLGLFRNIGLAAACAIALELGVKG